MNFLEVLLKALLQFTQRDKNIMHFFDTTQLIFFYYFKNTLYVILISNRYGVINRSIKQLVYI